jgi:hypothetical protein
MNKRKRRGVKSTTWMPTSDEFYKTVDAVFEGTDDRGWVHIAANSRGRVAVQAVFPRAIFSGWRYHEEDGWPADFKQNSIHLPTAASQSEHHLLLKITGGADLAKATTDALAFLLATSVQAQGVCVCHRVGGETRIFPPPDDRQH